MPRALLKFKSITFIYLFFLLLFFFGLPVNAVEKDDSVHPIYAGPSTYTVSVCTVENGDSVAVLSQINDSWSQIRLTNGTIGYCKNNLLQITYTEGENETKRVRTTQISKLFSAPDINSSVIASIPVNIQLSKSLDTNNGFTLVELPTGTTGYLLSDTLTLAPLSSAIIRPIPELAASTGITTETAAKERLTELSAFFEAGRYWNDYGAAESIENHKSFVISDTPCQHENYGYGHCNYYTSKISAALDYSYGSQCVGYAGLISDLIFGTEAPITEHSDFDRLRVGDHIRLVLWDHSMLVTDVGKDENGKTFVYVTEVNADYETCRIDWNRKFTQDDLRRLGDYIEVHSRYPEASQN